MYIPPSYVPPVPILLFIVVMIGLFIASVINMRRARRDAAIVDRAQWVQTGNTIEPIKCIVCLGACTIFEAPPDDIGGDAYQVICPICNGTGGGGPTNPFRHVWEPRNGGHHHVCKYCGRPYSGPATGAEVCEAKKHFLSRP